MQSILKNFIKQLPSSFKNVAEIVHKHGLTLTIVGGIPRDYFLHQKIGKDWDLELSSSTVSFNKDFWKELAHDLGVLGKVLVLPYEVIRLQIEDSHFELSPPRIEHYVTDWRKQGHSNFDATFDLRLEFETSILRRDFTINSIGFRYPHSEELVLMDPAEGVRHLKERTLYPVGLDFEKDPVRFFRALRFSRNLGFSLSSQLRSVMEVMPVDTIAPAHLWSEFQKCHDPFSFYQDLLDWKKIHPSLKLPIDEQYIDKKHQLQKLISDPAKHELWIMGLEWVGIDSGDWRDYFSLSVEKTKRLTRWAKSTKDLVGLSPELFQSQFEESILKPEFELIFDWYFTTKQLLQKNPELPLLKMIEDYAPIWSYLFKFEALKDVRHIDPPLRAKYQVWNLCQRI